MDWVPLFVIKLPTPMHSVFRFLVDNDDRSFERYIASLNLSQPAKGMRWYLLFCRSLSFPNKEKEGTHESTGENANIEKGNGKEEASTSNVAIPQELNEPNANGFVCLPDME